MDPYLPALDGFEYSPAQLASIAEAEKTDNPWIQACVGDVKETLKRFHLERQRCCCCYCREPFASRHQIQIDREHILPQKKFPTLVFNVKNISVACKRCNMGIKHSRTDFVVDVETILENFENADRYLLVHPNFEVLEDHIMRFSVQCGTKSIVKFRIINESEKGHYTYAFFKLREYVENCLDAAQGGREIDSDGEKFLTKLQALL